MKRTFFIGQAPARPESKHHIAGIYLHAWLKQIGVTEQEITHDCIFEALVGHFPGQTKNGHITPTPADIQSYRPTLVAKLGSWQPQVVVPVGKMAIQTLLATPHTPLTDIIGRSYKINPFDALGAPIPCIPLPHPSGRSVWNVQHQEQVSHALELLKDELRAT